MTQLPTTDWCAKWALYSPEKIAFKEFETGRTLTYGRLNQAANSLAWLFTRQYGLTKGDRIAILADYSLEYMALFAMAQKTGIILVPLNYRLTSSELDFMLKNAAPGMVITEPKYQHLLDSARTYSRVKHRISTEELTAGLTTKELTEPFPPAIFKDYDPVFILYTSGTTGHPKGALYTHKMQFWNSINTAISLIVNAESRTLLFAPPFHTGGWNVLTTPFLHHGGYTCILKKFDPATVLTLLQTERCTLFFGVPTMLKMLADEPAFTQATFPELHYVIVGGEPLPLPLIEIWTQKGVPVRQGYGLTEVGPNLTSLHQDDAVRKRGSIGRPNFYVETFIADEQGQLCRPDQPGELWLRGPMVTPGYWRNKSETTRAFASGGWFRTGDLVRQDAEGYLYVVDRIKNMFISGGENVYPVELERILQTHPVISEAAVVGVPDDKWGEVGIAFVVCKPGHSISEEDVIHFCKQHLAKYKVPKKIVFLEALPKNDTGKINRISLKQRALAT